MKENGLKLCSEGEWKGRKYGGELNSGGDGGKMSIREGGG